MSTHRKDSVYWMRKAERIKDELSKIDPTYVTRRANIKKGYIEARDMEHRLRIE